MKLIACLLILSLFFAFWSNSFTGPTVGEAPEGEVVLEQLYRGPSPLPWWWRDVWAEWLCPPAAAGESGVGSFACFAGSAVSSNNGCSDSVFCGEKGKC